MTTGFLYELHDWLQNLILVSTFFLFILLVLVSAVVFRTHKPDQRRDSCCRGSRSSSNGRKRHSNGCKGRRQSPSARIWRNQSNRGRQGVSLRIRGKKNWTKHHHIQHLYPVSIPCLFETFVLSCVTNSFPPLQTKLVCRFTLFRDSELLGILEGWRWRWRRRRRRRRPRRFLRIHHMASRIFL